MPPCGAINFTHVACNFNKCRGRAETAGHYHSCPYLDETGMGLITIDHYEIIKKKDKKLSTDEEPLSTILEELFEKYKAPSTNVNLTDGNNTLRIVPFLTPLLFRFTRSSLVTMRNGSLDNLIRLLEETEKPILTLNSHKPFSNTELAAIVRNATKNVDIKLDTIHANVQQHRCQHWIDCCDYYCKAHSNHHQMRGRYIRLEDTICSICRHKGNGYLSCS